RGRRNPARPSRLSLRRFCRNSWWVSLNTVDRRIGHARDDNEQAQHRSQKEQDGSELRSVELERLIAEGMTLIERQNSMEIFRDQAADRFERHTGSSWRPRSIKYQIAIAK